MVNLGDLAKLANPNEKEFARKVVQPDKLDLIILFKISLIDQLSVKPIYLDNKREANQDIFDRLDFALTNHHCLNKYPNANLTNIPIIGSDDALILLTMFSSSS